MLGIPALIIVVRESRLQDYYAFLELMYLNHLSDIIVQGLFLRSQAPVTTQTNNPSADRRYIFVEQAGCVPSIPPSLFPLIAVLIWPLLFDLASLAYLGILFLLGNSRPRNGSNHRPGLIIRLIWVSRRKRRGSRASSETITLPHLLRLPISLFLGIFSTCFFSLLLLLFLVNTPNISVDSLHHDFQTVSIVPAVQWWNIPPFRAAVELRWLWASLGPGLATGLFPKERADRILGFLTAPVRQYRMKSEAFSSSGLTHADDYNRKWHQSVLRAAPDGSLPVYISRTSGSSYGEMPAVPPLVLQPTPAPYQQPETSSPHHIPEPDLQSKFSWPWETFIRPDEPFEFQDTSTQPGSPVEPVLAIG